MEETVEVKRIVAALEKEIERLKEARALLTGISTTHTKRAAPGRARGSRMSAAARRRISEAMRKRWADRKKQAKNK
jgi:hypothetical protein